MKTSTAVIGGIVVVAVIGGFIFFSMGNAGPSSTNATSTPSSTNVGQTDPSGQTPLPGAPAVATNATASPTETTVVVSGNVAPNGAFTSYWYEFGTTASLGKRSSSQTVGSGYTSIPAPAYITGLTKDTTYYFRLVAENQFGTTAGSQQLFHTTIGTPPPVGSAPTTKTLAATGVSRTAANVNGEVTPNKSSTQYWFEYGASADLGNVSALKSVGDGDAKVPASLALSDLTPATTYHFRLNAQNQFGTVLGAILTFKTSGPAASVAPVVTTQVANPVATTSATVRGTVNPSGTQTTYWFEYSSDSLLGAVLVKTTSRKSAGAGTRTVSVESNVSSLQAGTTYYYRIVAQSNADTVRGDKLTFKTK